MKFNKKTFLLVLPLLFVLPFLGLFLGLSLANFAGAADVLAGAVDVPAGAVNVPIFGNIENFRLGAGYAEVTEARGPLFLIGHFFSILLGLLGVIALIIIVVGGWKWMTAGGSDEKIGAAKKLIVQGIIGLIIVMAAYAIAWFVLKQLAREFFIIPPE